LSHFSHSKNEQRQNHCMEKVDELGEHCKKRGV
jgi:hypothetical protein